MDSENCVPLQLLVFKRKLKCENKNTTLLWWKCVPLKMELTGFYLSKWNVFEMKSLIIGNITSQI